MHNFLPVLSFTFPVVSFSIRYLLLELLCFPFQFPIMQLWMLISSLILVLFPLVPIFGFTTFISFLTRFFIVFPPMLSVSVPVSSSLLKSNIFPMFGPKSSIQIRIQTKRNKVFLSYLSKIQSDRSFSFLCFSLSRLLFWSHSLLVEFLFSYLC